MLASTCIFYTWPFVPSCSQTGVTLLSNYCVLWTVLRILHYHFADYFKDTFFFAHFADEILGNHHQSPTVSKWHHIRFENLSSGVLILVRNADCAHHI